VKKMSSRKLVSVMLFYNLIAMFISGIVLYIMPHGRVAYWTGWTFLGLSKDDWDGLHTIFGFLMLIFGIWHTILNWKPIVNYIKGKAKSVFSREFGLSSIIVVVVFLGTLFEVPPFSTILAIGEVIKNSWEKPKVQTPVPHAELLSIKRLSEMLGIDVNKAIKILKEKGIDVKSPNDILKDIAIRNKLKPSDIYEILSSHSNRGININQNRGLRKGQGFGGKNVGNQVRDSRFVPGSGFGRRSLGEICKEIGLGKDECLGRLKNKGIEANIDEVIRDVASRNNLYPYDIIAILEGKK